jgi:ATP adenylyltransferase
VSFAGVLPDAGGETAQTARANDEDNASMTERLWAPWRLAYIERPKDGPCVFCSLAAAPPEHFREKLVLVAQEHAFVCLNLYPFAAGHLLVAPRLHVADVGELPADAYDALMRLTREAIARLRAAFEPEGVNLGMNLGRAAGAGIADHLHAHAVPRWSGDSNFMPVLADTRVMPQYLEDSWSRLAPFFADVAGQHPAP